jgi:hypothetical protein
MANYRASFWLQVSRRTVLLLALAAASVSAARAGQAIARDWDEQALAAIRLDRPHPPVHARNLFSLSVCMYDAWAAYDPVAVGYVYRGKHSVPDLAAARREAISYAAYRILMERYALSLNSTNTLQALSAHMLSLGYDTNNTSRDTSTPAGVGNSVYDAVSSWFINDGARQTNNYVDATPGQGGYLTVNRDYLVTGMSGTTLTDVNHWQPLAIADALDQNGRPEGPLQKFLGSQWLGVRPFALNRSAVGTPWIDPGPMPRLGTASTEEFRTNVVEVIRRSSQLTPDDGALVDISPASFGNNSLGANDGAGYPVNPFTGQPYAPTLVKRGDFARVLAEFWADGPNSETPPGHWNVLANFVSDDPAFQKRLGGAGPVVDDLEWEVKLYVALNAALHDAACAAWGLKRYYDGWRPISAIRYMGQSGQCTDPAAPAYTTNGLPLVPDLIELVTTNSAAPGGRHAGLKPNTVALFAWPGQPANPTNQYSGVKWIQAADWLPYQKKTFVTPAFPGYISGHSTFSRAAAEVLAAITGSPFFPGGLSSYSFPQTYALTFEQGPTQPIDLQWATYYDAADQAGLSRLWGGIHPPVDDLTGRRTGAQCGKLAWALVQKYFDGSILNVPATLSLRLVGGNLCEVRCSALRGFYYTLQSTTDPSLPFVNEPSGATLAYDTVLISTNTVVGSQKFYRAVLAAVPAN